MSLLANTYLLARRYEEALESAQHALEIARRYHERGPEAWALYLFAASMAQLQPEEREGIREGYLAAARLAEHLGMRPLVAHCRLGLGKFHAEHGDKNKAREELQGALTMYSEMEMQYWQIQADAALEALS